MGALAVINGVGRVPATNGVVDDSAIPTTIARDTELPTVNNATLTVNGGSGLAGSGTFTANQSTANTITLTHADTSSQATSNNSGTTFIQDITLDTYGHVTGIGTATAGGGGAPSITGVGSYILMQGTRSNTQYGAGSTVAPNGDGRERYGVTYGRNGASGSGDFQSRTTTAQGNAISGGTWRSQSHGITNQYAVNLMVRIS